MTYSGERPMASTLPSLQPAALRKNVAEILRNALFDGHYPPGDELSDSTLAAEFQVSRGPVREALLILAEEGMIEHRHHRGFFVPRLEVLDLEQIARTRRPLEIMALELGRGNITAAALKDLRTTKKDLLAAFRRYGIAGCEGPTTRSTRPSGASPAILGSRPPSAASASLTSPTSPPSISPATNTPRN
jgi:DNA-binding GntR family transcriptional regulator